MIRKKYIVLLSGYPHDVRWIDTLEPLRTGFALSPSRSPIKATFHPYVAYIAERPADTVMHETHERDNLCHFSRERPVKRDRNENRFADTLMGLLRSVCDSRRTIQINVLRDSTEIRRRRPGNNRRKYLTDLPTCHVERVNREIPCDLTEITDV